MTEQTAPSLAIPAETMRKLVHIGFGLFALSLKWLTPTQAALVATAAFVFNFLILPHVGGKAISRGARGHDFGIVVYPLAVLALILVFWKRLDLAGMVWVILAFGDGCATLFGRVLRGPKLPWNGAKSVIGTLAFVEIGLPAAYLTLRFLSGDTFFFIPRFFIALAAVLVAATVESLPLGIDDNITVPLTAGFTAWILSSLIELPHLAVDGRTWIWLGVNAALAVAGYAARSVDVSGMLGGFALGAILLLGGGWELYVVLLAFFIIGSGLTRAGYRRKRELGLAQEKGGRRGFGHAFANVGVAAICATLMILWPGRVELLWIAAIASLATAAADTTGSEIGQWLGRRAFLPLTFRRVPVGTEGAISIEGTSAGLVVALFMALFGTWTWSIRGGVAAWDRHLWTICGIVAAAGFLGSYLESLVGNWNRTKADPLPNGVLNFLNTLIGASIGIVLLAAVPR